MKLISVRDLRPGDVIHGEKKPIPVRTLGRGESCNGMHVNENLCYDRCANITVQR